MLLFRIPIQDHWISSTGFTIQNVWAKLAKLAMRPDSPSCRNCRMAKLPIFSFVYSPLCLVFFYFSGTLAIIRSPIATSLHYWSCLNDLPSLSCDEACRAPSTPLWLLVVGIMIKLGTTHVVAMWCRRLCSRCKSRSTPGCDSL